LIASSWCVCTPLSVACSWRKGAVTHGMKIASSILGAGAIADAINAT